MRQVFRPGRYANVASTLALVVALGGTSYAAVALPRSSVGNTQLKANAVTSSKVKDRTLLSKDFKAGELPAGPRGPVGAPGAPGPKGDTGAPGASATRLWAVIDTSGPAPSLLRGSGVTAVQQYIQAGRSSVVFDRDISACGWLATVQETGDWGQVVVFRYAGTPNDRLGVSTFDFDGNYSGRIVHLAVFC